MGLKVIPSSAENDLNSGERRVLNKLRKIYADIDRRSCLYIQPNIRKYKPDFILIDAIKGLSILEVKDWAYDYLGVFNPRNVYTRDGREYDNPLHKTLTYYNEVKRILERNKILYDLDGDLSVNLEAKAVFCNLSGDELKIINRDGALNHRPAGYISKDQLVKLTVDNIFRDQVCSLDDNFFSKIRAILFPETRIIDTEGSKDEKEKIKSLDLEQEEFAKRMPFGHYMVTGVPGSGKTIILIARVFHLLKLYAQEKSDFKILIVTYTQALKDNLQKTFKIAMEDEALNYLPLHKIEVKTFHSFAKEIATETIPSGETKSEQWWAYELPQKALQFAKEEFDAVFVDEYQDFYDDWIKLCLRVCKTKEYLNYQGQKTKGKNIFLAGDRLQSIYLKREQNWKELGIDMRGRSKLLKKSYRIGKSNIDLALDFLMHYPQLKKEVESFYEGREGISDEGLDKKSKSFKFLKGSYNFICDKIEDLLEEGFRPDDIMLVFIGKRSMDNFFEKMPHRLRQKTRKAKGHFKDKVILMTYHSAKGLQKPVCILMETDKMHYLKKEDILQKKLLYVGMTRASKKLFIHAEDFEKESYAKHLWNIAKNTD